MNLLWIVPKWPFPATDGARIATTQLLKNITELGIQVHLCALVPVNEGVDVESARRELGVSGVTLVKRKKPSRWAQFLAFLRRPWFPVTLSMYANRRIADQVAILIENGTFDLVLYDGLHSAAWKSFVREPILKIKEAYRAHNVESEIWFRSAKDEKNTLKRWLLLFQGLLVKRIEQRLSRECDFVFPVSFSDEKKFLNYAHIQQVHTVPIGMSVQWNETPVSQSGERRTILFVGKLDWAPNRHGLEWVLKEVWPSVIAQANDLELLIVGSGDGRWLEPYLKLPGVRFVGQVESLTPYYEKSMATLVPIFYGSGTRVKVIESILHGRPCISTEIGVEGVGLVPEESYRRVETVQEWVETLVHFRKEDAFRIGQKAREYAKNVFDPQVIAQHLIQKISLSR